LLAADGCGTQRGIAIVLIREFHIENFKSIASLDLELGRVNVLIGENGCGKSNVLEAIGFASAGVSHKVEHEHLAARGIRMPDARFVFSAFSDAQPSQIDISVLGTAGSLDKLSVAYDARAPGNAWTSVRGISREKVTRIQTLAAELHAGGAPSDDPQRIRRFTNEVFSIESEGLEPLVDFLIYSPENSALRTFLAEGQILPLGVRGEGLFSHLKSLSKTEEGRVTLARISEQLQLLDWFRALSLDADLAPGERTLLIGDRYLAESLLFDQRSANEGFLFLLFYFTLCISPSTPRFFAIDNVDASLNPRLCEELTRRLVQLAKQHDKQIILTTHNPAVLDGLDLGDDEQRLLVVHRSRKGHTKVRRIEKPTAAEGATPVRLSEAFLRGYLGGLPKNF